MKNVGQVTVYWGSMFSGKTTALIKEMIEAGSQSICFKPKTDTRGSDDIVTTHDGDVFPVTVVEQASDILMLLEPEITTVGIEEASLFLDDPTLVPTIEALRNLGYHVVVSGLDVSSEGEPFGQMPTIAAISDNCYKLRTKCAKCGSPASISYYKGGSKGVVKVGGEESYEPRCRNCI